MLGVIGIRYVKKKINKYIPKSELKSEFSSRFNSISKVNKYSDKMQKFENEINKSKSKVIEIINRNFSEKKEEISSGNRLNRELKF